jgi:hypothetical protein
MAIYYSASYIHYHGHIEKKHYSGFDVSSIKEGKNHKLFNCVNNFELFHQPSLGPQTAPKTRLIFLVAIFPTPVKQILYPHLLHMLITFSTLALAHQENNSCNTSREIMQSRKCNIIVLPPALQLNTAGHFCLNFTKRKNMDKLWKVLSTIPSRIWSCFLENIFLEST